MLIKYVHIYVTWRLSFFQAICSQGCYNNGTCTSPGNCTCTKGWRGHNCSAGNSFYYHNLIFTYSTLDYICIWVNWKNVNLKKRVGIEEHKILIVKKWIPKQDEHR